MVYGENINMIKLEIAVDRAHLMTTMIVHHEKGRASLSRVTENVSAGCD